MRLPVLAYALSLALLSGMLPGGAQACGQSADDHCEVADGSYRIAVPEGTQPQKVLIWLHGAGGSADGVMKNAVWRDQLASRGYALIAPQGILKNYTRYRKNWAVNDGRPYARDDIQFLARVVEDSVARHGLRRDQILLGGFSRGGSMVWDIACQKPGLARAYAPVAGAFWEPMWPSCEAPVDVFHTHGWTDRTVPLEGRPLRGGAMTQGDVFQSLFILRETNGCTNRQPESTPLSDIGDRWYRSWSDCREGRIDLMLHPGGHTLPKGWLGLALDWFEARLEERCEPALAQGSLAKSCG